MARRIHYGRFVLIILLFATSLSLSAQSLEGARMLSGTLNTGFLTGNGNKKFTDGERESNTGVGYNIIPYVSYGKVNQKNLLVAYGVAATFYYNKGFWQKNQDTADYLNVRNYIVSPTLTLQKYVALSTRLYYTPVFNFHLGYGWYKHIDFISSSSIYKYKQYSVGAEFTPLGLTYVAKPKLFLSFGLGHASLDYDYIKGKSRTKSGSEIERHKSNALGFNAFTNYFSFGIQKILSASK